MRLVGDAKEDAWKEIREALNAEPSNKRGRGDMHMGVSESESTEDDTESLEKSNSKRNKSKRAKFYDDIMSDNPFRR